MKSKKGALLFEVMLVVLLVSLASVYMFRGYSIFLKAGRRSLDYLKLILLSEKVIWDLQLREKQGKWENISLPNSLASKFNWDLRFKNSQYINLKKSVLKVEEKKRKSSLETVTYLIQVQEAESQ